MEGDAFEAHFALHARQGGGVRRIDDGDRFVEHFGSLGASFFTFFQIMTLEGWSGEIVRPVMEVYPWAWVFFVPYIVLATFMVLNLFIGIVVDAMQQQTSEADEKIIDEVHVDAARVLQEVARLRAELRLVAEGKPLPHIEQN
jgi:voltage-gated sodium channel